MTVLDHEVTVPAPLTQLEPWMKEEKDQTDQYCSLTGCDQEELRDIISYLEKVGHL
jgi:hypothetical protein